MAAEKFTIKTEVIYTIKSKHGEVKCKSVEELQQHVEDVLGVLVDTMHSYHNGNYNHDKLKDHKFITKNRGDFETIFAMIDAVDNIKSQAECHNHHIQHTPDESEYYCKYYCNRCGSGSGIEYVGD